jgi:hypothetical protein
MQCEELVTILAKCINAVKRGPRRCAPPLTDLLV